VKALGIPRLGSGRMYVEYRTAFGFDASLGSRIGPRVQLTTGTNTLIDLTPATTTWDDASLTVGATYDEAGTGIRVQLLPRPDRVLRDLRALYRNFARFKASPAPRVLAIFWRHYLREQPRGIRRQFIAARRQIFR
jgi:hypothetical protein